jgi:hypothetical protein
MKIIIALELVPFAREDSTLACAQQLARRLESAGHTVHTIRLPFGRKTETDVVQSFLATRLVSLQNADRLVVMDSYVGALQHSFKIGWISGRATNPADSKSTGFDKEITALMVADCRRFVVDQIPESNPMLQVVKDQGKPTQIVSRTKENVIPEENWDQIIQLIAA